MGRPRLDQQNAGLTRPEIAKQLGYSTSKVRRLQERGELPARRDGGGIFRSDPRDVADYARKVGKALASDGGTVARIYRHFLAPGFKFSSESIARVVVDTEQHPDLVVALWHKFKHPDATIAKPAAVYFAPRGNLPRAAAAFADVEHPALVEQRAASLLAGEARV